MRQLLSTALVALIVGALAGATVSAMAQQPATDRPVVTAGVNADTVDGRHAVAATSVTKARANKLVAADKTGYLPSNVVKPRWGLIQGVPAGFADGSDDGMTKLTITLVHEQIGIGASGQGIAYANCPSGSKVLGGGFDTSSYQMNVVASSPNGQGWYAAASNPTASTNALHAYAICAETTPYGLIATGQ